MQRNHATVLGANRCRGVIERESCTPRTTGKHGDMRVTGDNGQVVGEHWPGEGASEALEMCYVWPGGSCGGVCVCMLGSPSHRRFSDPPGPLTVIYYRAQSTGMVPKEQAHG